MAVAVHAPVPLEASAGLLQDWRKVPVAVTVDLDPGIRQLDPDIRPLRAPGSQPLLFGRVVTAHCEPPDFGAVMYSLDLVEAGDVLVIAAGGHRDHAMIGEILGGHLQSKGVAGVVCDGAVRDVANLAALDGFPVFTRHVTPRGPTGKEKGAVNIPVEISGVSVEPGDLIIGDDDGLVALGAEDLARFHQPALDRLAEEEGWVNALSSGKSAKDVFGL